MRFLQFVLDHFVVLDRISSFSLEDCLRIYRFAPGNHFYIDNPIYFAALKLRVFNYTARRSDASKKVGFTKNDPENIAALKILLG